MLRRQKEENYDLLLDGSRANILKTAAAAKVVVCNSTNLLSDERKRLFAGEVWEMVFARTC